MNNKILIVGALALVIGLGGGYALGMQKAPENNTHMMSDGAAMHDSSMGMSGQMDDMMRGLEGKTGDEFDKAFLSEMIMHHEGAVVMAQAALKDAKHQEIKDLANGIITAQNTEIKQMQDWQQSWYR